MSFKNSIARILYAFLLTSIFTLSFGGKAHAADDGKKLEVPTSDEAINKGETLFKNNCAVCHAVHEQVVGPALKGVYKQRPLPWILKFVKNSQSVIQSGDEFAVKLYNEYNKTVMPNWDLSNDEILSIMAYVKQQTENPPKKETASSGVSASAAGQGGGGSGIPSSYLTAILVGLLIVLALILVVLVLIVSVLTRFLNQKEDLDEADKEVVNQRFNLNKIVRSGAFIGLVIFLFTAVVAKNVIDGLFTVGIQQGYQPTQPIAFSHKIHAGQYKIDCNYCHTGVRKAKNANIPSPNICMNCHSQIKTNSPEIKKIYAAVENNTPIEWVRVHNLPDLVYFSHQQHVKVGQLECQQCHGPIETMPVVKQWAPLTMGWCINCHRKTQVQTKGNHYYDKLVKEHEGKDLKVVDIGGLECARCHY